MSNIDAFPNQPGAWTGRAAPDWWKKTCACCERPFHKTKRPKAEAVEWRNRGVTLERFVCRPCLDRMNREPKDG